MEKTSSWGSGKAIVRDRNSGRSGAGDDPRGTTRLDAPLLEDVLLNAGVNKGRLPMRRDLAARTESTRSAGMDRRSKCSEAG